MDTHVSVIQHQINAPAIKGETQMKKWAALLVLSASFTTNVFAETAQNRDKLQYLQFSENELQSVFAKDDKEKMDIVALSQNEMQETKGAWIWMAYYFAPGATAFAYNLYNTSAYMPIYHLSHFVGSNWRR
jgi:hypothetical protein